MSRIGYYEQLQLGSSANMGAIAVNGLLEFGLTSNSGGERYGIKDCRESFDPVGISRFCLRADLKDEGGSPRLRSDGALKPLKWQCVGVSTIDGVAWAHS